jgi:hypothetical protein
MVSSKLSSRRFTPKKPSVCISIPPPIPPGPPRIYAHILWTTTAPETGPIDIDEQGELIQDPDASFTYRYQNPDPGPNEIVDITVNAPNDEIYNYALIGAYDEWMQLHVKEQWWEPATPPPFDVTITEWLGYTFPNDVISLHLYP